MEFTWIVDNETLNYGKEYSYKLSHRRHRYDTYVINGSLMSGSDRIAYYVL